MRESANLSLYLKRAGAISGPSLKPTRHSDLSLTKSWLCAVPITFGYKAHNNFGSAVHLQFLLNKVGKFKLTKEEIETIKKMLAALWANPVVRKLMSVCPVREKRRPARLNGTKIMFTPDATGRVVTLDLKTTVCRTLEEFIEAAFEYGYFRQGKTYSLALGTREYWIIGIQKQSPYKVFLVFLGDPKFRSAMDYVTRELEFLLYFYQNYGKPNYKRKKVA